MQIRSAVPVLTPPVRQAAPAPPPAEASPDQVSLGHSLALHSLDVVKYTGLLASTAAAGWLGGGPGILASMAGSAVGYGLYACSIHEGPSAFKAATAGALVGALGGLCGAIAGPEGMVVMGTLGAGGTLIAKTTNWFEGWTRDGRYVG